MGRLPQLRFRERYYISRSEIIGGIVLLAVIAGGMLVYFLFKDGSDEAPQLSTDDVAAMTAFDRSVRQADSVRMAQIRNGQGRALTPFPFDPNRADEATLQALGLKDWQVQNMMKYRAKGGKWRSPDDFARLYGLTQQEFETLRPYIRIAEADVRQAQALRQDTTHGKPLRYERVEKYAEGTMLDLNTVDTTQLKHIPGIGSYRARQIVTYRERLGGFLSLEQLAEIEDLPADISRWFRFTPVPVRRLPINKATFKQLVHHPYLSYEQTCDIMNYRRKFGPIHAFRDLAFSKNFTSADFERLKPYISFEMPH